MPSVQAYIACRCKHIENRGKNKSADTCVSADSFNGAAAHPNYSLLQTEENAFCNLQIIMNLGHWAMVSKEKSPAIHFVIRHPKLRGAIEKFSPPIVEK